MKPNWLARSPCCGANPAYIPGAFHEDVTMVMRILVIGLLLGTVNARAQQPVQPIAPQFIALSVPDAPASARWYSEAFGLRELAVIKPEDGAAHIIILTSDSLLRSEERRVGKECRSRW